jgi:hypothetical protein
MTWSDWSHLCWLGDDFPVYTPEPVPLSHIFCQARVMEGPVEVMRSVIETFGDWMSRDVEHF